MNEQQRRLAEIITSYRNGQISRRRAFQLLGAFGLTGIAASSLDGRSALAQDAGSPEAMATPALGPQADGTNMWKVAVGGMDMENGLDIHSFFPKEITINAGDSIYFEFAPTGMPGFHTVTFTSGEEVPELFVPDIVDGTPVASPEGPPRLLVNPMIAFPDGRAEYDGTGPVNSGLDVLRTEDAPPYTLKFTTPGTYDYYCAIHFVVMEGTITVQEAGSELPNDVAAYQAMADAEFAALVEEGMAATAAAAEATPTTGDGAAWDVSAGVGGLSPVRVMKFIPEEITIKVGDTVRWTDRTTGEPHTVTFLGGAEPPEDVLIEPQADGMPKLIQNYQSLLPMGDSTFDGNGYRNSGFLGLPPEVNEVLGTLGESYELTFTAPGEYGYYCILHAGGPDDEGRMIGKVTVEE